MIVIGVWIFGGWLLWAIVFCILCAYIASQRNRDSGRWAAAGFLFGIFALIALVAVPVLTDEEAKRRREARLLQDEPEEDPELEEWRARMKEELPRERTGASGNRRRLFEGKTARSKTDYSWRYLLVGGAIGVLVIAILVSVSLCVSTGT